MIDNKKQWFLLSLATVWLLIALAMTASIYYITRDTRTLGLATLIAPPITMLHRIYHYHFPPSPADYELQKLKLQLKKSSARRKKGP